MLRMAAVVMSGKKSGVFRDNRASAEDALSDIIRYYGLKPVVIPESIKDPEEQLIFALRPHGLMHRRIELNDKWYKDGFGPLLAFFKDGGSPVALLPQTFRGYHYRDAAGNMIKINDKNAGQFEAEAICFYYPLPLRSIGISDLITYLKHSIDLSDLIVMILLTVAVTMFGMMMPRITRMLTGFIYESGSVSALSATAVFIVCVLISSQLISAANSLATQRITTKVSLNAESAMMMRLMSLPASFFKNYSSGELSSRAQSIGTLCELMTNGVLSVGITSAASLLYIFQIFSYAPGLTVPALAIIAITVLVLQITTSMQRKISRQSMELAARENGYSFALITGVQKIKLAGAEKRAFAKWAEIYSKMARLTYDPPMFLRINTAITTAVSLFGTLILYFMAVKTSVSPSEYISFNAAYAMVMGAFLNLAGAAVSIANIEPILEMAEPVLKAEPELSEGREMITDLSGRIELNNVHFRYHENMPYVLDGISLTIKAGEYVAVVGRTGCGKSTLMRLLLGFEKAEKGAIYYDGRDINRIDLQSLRKNIGAVTQDGGLFQGDIYSNIVISAPRLTVNDAWEAAELAGMADDIRAMPMGMNTMISEGAGGISGGQKQRLMIARAVAPKPKILMFDEATSALDNMTQKQVSTALDSLNCTRIVIAHRLSTIKNCDRILVLDQGHIVEDGSYDELLEKGGYFAELVERQRLDN